MRSGDVPHSTPVRKWLGTRGRLLEMTVRRRTNFDRMTTVLGGIVQSCVLVLAVAGCSCVDVMPKERARIDQLHAEGISWSRERDAGRFTPPINMTAAVWWSLLPGAGQHFIAHKMKVYGYERFGEVRWRDRRQVRASGTLMLGTSWFPYVYVFTLPIGLASGVVVDVNRVNNLALLEWLDRTAEDAKSPVPAISPVSPDPSVSPVSPVPPVSPVKSE